MIILIIKNNRNLVKSYMERVDLYFYNIVKGIVLGLGFSI